LEKFQEKEKRTACSVNNKLTSTEREKGIKNFSQPLRRSGIGRGGGGEKSPDSSSFRGEGEIFFRKGGEV